MFKILVVDDEVQMRDFFHRALTLNGYDAVTVPSPEQAYDAVGQQRFDLILLDFHMPMETGAVVVKKLRDSQNRVPVVIYSGYLSTQEEKEAREAGANEVLIKDIGIASIIKQIEKILQAKERIFEKPEKKERSILVVDDEKSIRDLLKTFLKMKNYNVTEAENGEKALEIVAKENIPLALVDIRMPGMGGLETLKKLLEYNPKMGVVMVSGEQDNETVKKAVEQGAYGYIIKPFDFLYLELVVMSKLIIADNSRI